MTFRGFINALVFLTGLLFIAIGSLPYLPNPYVDVASILSTNDALNYVHIASGIVLLLGLLTGHVILALTLAFLAYTAAAISGGLSPSEPIFGHLQINEFGRYLYAGLALFLYFLLHYTIKVRDTW